MNYKDKLKEWIESEVIDENSKNEILDLNDEKEVEDRFYKNLEFGTAGLRGIVASGSNRLNYYTIGKATQGLANYLNNKYERNISVTIAYDSRNMSPEFSKATAIVLAANNIKVNLFEDIRSTPELSFAVRELNSNAGIVITASHNPKEYNGYKVYGNDGCQITDKVAEEISNEINKLDYKEIKNIKEEVAKEKGLINIIGKDIDDKYINTLKEYTIRRDLVKDKAESLNIVYTSLHGTGLMPIKRILEELGYKSLSTVKEQDVPDGNFPTAEYPNPEDPKVFELALGIAKKSNADIIIGTDPDADRIGVVSKDSKGVYRILTGNQMGVLLSNYIIRSYFEQNKLPVNGAIVKTIVSTDMVNKIARGYLIDVFEVLTGFKYIGTKINEFKESNSNKFLFGFEESYGCLFGEHARDKDAVVAAQMICEMALYYKGRSMTLYDGFVELCEKYGFYKEKMISKTLNGADGEKKIISCTNKLRKNNLEKINGIRIKEILDYSKCINGLPSANVIKFILEDKSWFVVRPSGTEPKVKLYLSVLGKSIEDSENKMNKFEKSVTEIFDSMLN